MSTPPNVKQAVPFFGVADLDASLKFYCQGLGFDLVHQWAPDGRLRWCSLKLGEASLMLQEFWSDASHPGRPDGPLGLGVTVCFICEDALALYRGFRARGLSPSRPFVGNAMWVTSLTDPDGYRLDFESPTEVDKDTQYDDAALV